MNTIEQEMLQFAEDIEERVGRGNTYIDAIVEYSEEMQLEMEIVSKLVTGRMAKKIKMEAENRRLIKKSDVIPLEL